MLPFFTQFGGPQGHEDRMASRAPVGNRRCWRITNSPQATSLPYNWPPATDVLTMFQPYFLHIPFVLLFLALVVCFIAVHIAKERD